MNTSHCDESDEEGRSNHERVKVINSMLQQHGLVTWMDEERMRGNVVDQMCKGASFYQ